MVLSFLFAKMTMTMRLAMVVAMVVVMVVVVVVVKMMTIDDILWLCLQPVLFSSQNEDVDDENDT